MLAGLLFGDAGDAATQEIPPPPPTATAEEARPEPVAEAVGLVADRQATEAALKLFNAAVTVQADGTHNRLLRALRHLQDPALGPLFLGLSQAAHPSLRVHGILGLAEINQPRGLTVAQIAQVERADVQAELISAALDGDLINDDTRLTLLGWPGLDPGLKLLLATPWVASGAFDSASPGYLDLVAALDHEAPGRRGLAALLLHQLGDERGTQTLGALAHDTDPAADAVRAMLLETAWAHGLNGGAGWAFDVAATDEVPTRLEMLALKVAIRFGDDRADPRWSQQLAGADDASRQTWLALVGLEAAPWLSPERFDPLLASTDPLITQLGRTGQAVSQSRLDGTDHTAAEQSVIELINTAHPQACRWAADYAKETGSASLAAAVVTQTPPGEPRGRARRLDAVVRATQTLIELDPGTAERLLAAALSAESAETAWQRGVLLGLIRSRSDAAQRIGQSLPVFTDRETAALVLVLQTQGPEPLDEDEIAALELLIRGGAELDDSLRVQTAWAYLQRTGQGAEAIAAVLASP